MVNYFKSEYLKLKQTPILYFILIVTVLEIILFPIYLLFHSSCHISEEIIFLSLLLHPIMTSVSAILGFEQETFGNHLQNIRCQSHPYKIWTAKLLVRDSLFSLSTLLIWTSVGVVLEKMSFFFGAAVVICLGLIFLNHFHFLLLFFFGRTTNLMMSLLEILFLIFASNSVFLRMYCLPVILPVNAIINNKRFLSYIVSLCFWIILVYILNLLSLHKQKLQKR